MLERIQKLADMVAAGKMYIQHTDTEYDREDLFLSPLTMQAKRSAETVMRILNEDLQDEVIRRTQQVV